MEAKKKWFMTAMNQRMVKETIIRDGNPGCRDNREEESYTKL